MKNKLRLALLERRLTFGAWIQIGHPACAEIFANAGFDWVCVDMEHGAINFESMTDIFRAIQAFDCVPVVRLPANDPVWIHRSLDAGARAIIIPMIKTAEETQRAVREAKYPPMGERGFGFSRANLHGAAFSEYISEANEEIAMIMQIEHKDAIPNLDAILRVKGVDGLFIGPYDLSGSMGIPGKLDHPGMLAALENFRNACNRHGKTAGMHIVHPNPENIAKSKQEGYTLIALGADVIFLRGKADESLRLARE